MAEYTRPVKEYEEKVIQIKRVSKKSKGGNKMAFTALVVVGNRMGKAGLALGKGKTVADAVQKAVSRAKENMIEVDVKGNTIPHPIEKKFKSAKILLMPAPQGSGIIAGGSVRDVLELVGVKDISSKMLGSNNKINNLLCTFAALQDLRKRNA
jgi:small subunit ribosomal protein S5